MKKTGIVGKIGGKVVTVPIELAIHNADKTVDHVATTISSRLIHD